MKIARINQSKELLIKGELIESNIDRTRLLSNGNIETFEYIEGSIAGIKNNNLLGLELIELAQLEVQAFSPADIPNLKMWLDATQITANDGDKVSQWSDLSGNNNHAVQGSVSLQPTFKDNVFNGKPAVRFAEETYNLLNTGNIALGERTYVVVMEAINPGRGSWHSVILQSAAPYYQIYGNTNGTTLRFYLGSDIALPVNIHRKALIVITTTQGQTNFYIDGQNVLTSTAGSNTVINSPFSIGGWAIASYGLNGNIAELLMYSGVLTDVDRQSIENYLMSKWGLV